MELNIEQSLLQLIPTELAWQYHVIPHQITDNVLNCWCSNTASTEVIFDLEMATGHPIAIAKCSQDEITPLLKKYYPQVSLRKQLDLSNKEKLLENLIEEAKEVGSSDIHIEPYEKRARVRYRIDGQLIERFEVELMNFPSLVNKIKIFAKLDIAQKRLPQDGRIHIQTNKVNQELRVSSLPTLYGEKIVLRLLGNSTDHLEIQSIGMNNSQLAEYLKAVEKPHGIVLISGPTGSGKTTTLYATLKHLNHVGTNIMTVEDPIEYTLEGINQVQLNEAIDLTFEAALKSFLRQDPDIIMLGEIRDGKTAQMAIRAALTGHLVLSTIHTNSAWETINRLIDMGVPAFLIANTLNVSVAQRLVRLLCPHCKQIEPSSAIPKNLCLDQLPDVIYTHNGCEHCNYTGYKGRSAIYETIGIDETQRQAIIHHQASHKNSNTKDTNRLKHGAWNLFVNGQTSFTEITALLQD